MTDHDDLMTILQQGEGSVELSTDVANRIRAAMHDELDRTLQPGANSAGLSPDATVVLFPTSTEVSASWRFVSWVAAALLVAVGAAALFVVNNRTTDMAEPPATDPVTNGDAAEVAEPTPPYLVACLGFIGSTSNVDRPWPEALAAIGPDSTDASDYLERLAQALDTLVSTSPEVRPAVLPLQRAAIEARSTVPDIDVVTRQLELAQDTLLRKTGLPCITATDDA